LAKLITGRALPARAVRRLLRTAVTVE